MATVNIMKNRQTQNRSGLKFILGYCMREAKTLYDDERLISGFNCSPKTVYQEFMSTKARYNKTDGRMFYHIVQSFHPEEDLTPDDAHKLAIEFAEQNFYGYEVLVSTHVDKRHLHSHFVVNSVSYETGYKYHSDNGDIDRLRKASDKLCIEYGLSVVEPKEQACERITPREYHAKMYNESWKNDLILTIENAMRLAKNKKDFINIMNAEGYEVKWTNERKNITYTTPEGYRCRDTKLHHEKFLKENMEKEFKLRSEIAKMIKEDNINTNHDFNTGWQEERDSYGHMTYGENYSSYNFVSSTARVIQDIFGTEDNTEDYYTRQSRLKYGGI